MTVRGHACASDLERLVCDEMDRQGLAHEHRSLRFRVADDAGGTQAYAPAIVARRGSILFLVEPITSAADRNTIGRLERFLAQHSTELVLVAVTAEDAVDQIPREAYDEIYAASDVGRLTARIRSQDPTGMVRPFDKPRPRKTAE